MYSCWVKIFQKRGNICRWLGPSPLASAFLLIDESSTHNQAMESFKKCPPLPCFFNSSCVDSFSPCLLRDYSRHQSCSSAFLVPFLHRGALCPLSSSSHHTQRDEGSPFRHRFSIFFSSHAALFSSGFTLPGNGFQRIHSEFPIFNIRFSSLGNTRALPT